MGHGTWRPAPSGSSRISKAAFPTPTINGFPPPEPVGPPWRCRLPLKRAAFDPDAVPAAPLYFNQASPSAYVRGNTRAVPLALSLMRALELGGARVLNGSQAFLLELSKSAQIALLRKLGIPHPRSLAFNDPEAALAQWTGGWPALLKPEQGGSGARMFLLQ